MITRIAAILALSAAAASAQETRDYTQDTWVLGEIQSPKAQAEEGPATRTYKPYSRVRRALPGAVLAELDGPNASCAFVYKGVINATPAQALFTTICKNNGPGSFVETHAIPVGTNGTISLRCSYFVGGERPAIDIKVQEMRELGDATLEVKLVPGAR